MFILEQIKSVTKQSLITDIWPLWYLLYLMVKVIADQDFGRDKILKEPVSVNTVILVLPLTQRETKFTFGLRVVMTNHLKWFLRWHEKTQIFIFQMTRSKNLAS